MTSENFDKLQGAIYIFVGITAGLVSGLMFFMFPLLKSGAIFYPDAPKQVGIEAIIIGGLIIGVGFMLFPYFQKFKKAGPVISGNIIGLLMMWNIEMYVSRNSINDFQILWSVIMSVFLIKTALSPRKNYPKFSRKSTLMTG